MGHGDVVADNS